MLIWRYGLIKDPDHEWYRVHEVYLDKDGKSWTEDGVVPAGETPEEVVLELERMLKDIKEELANGLSEED